MVDKKILVKFQRQDIVSDPVFKNFEDIAAARFYIMEVQYKGLFVGDIEIYERLE